MARAPVEGPRVDGIKTVTAAPTAARGGAPGAECRKILVIEDERDIRELVRVNLEAEGFAVLEAGNGELGLALVKRERPAAVILDLMLPGLGGLEVCRRIRSDEETARVPVVMLTARSAEADKVVGLEIGADDYVTKPFSLRELAARVRAVLRRGAPGEDDRAELYRGRHLEADFDAVAISVDGAAVRLTRREFELLRCLVKNRNRVLSRDRLLERVWGHDHFIETRSVDVHVGRLRAKLGRAGEQIETVVGLGYRFVE